MTSAQDTVNTLDRLFQLNLAGHAAPVAKSGPAITWPPAEAGGWTCVEQALDTIGNIVDALEMYAPGLNGLLEVHALVTDQLKVLVFDRDIREENAVTAASLYGQAMAMSTITVEGLSPAIEALLRRNDASAANRVLSVLLGVEGTNQTLFEAHLPILLRQVQQVAFSHIRTSTPKRALEAAMKLYAPGEKSTACQLLLQAVHALLVASLRLCETENTRWQGIDWVCFIVQSLPMKLRLDLQRQYSTTCNAVGVFSVISPVFKLDAPDEIRSTLCRTLPILTTWDTHAFVSGGQARDSISFMMGLCRLGGGMLTSGLYGVGKMSNVILEEFEPYLSSAAELALSVLKGQGGKEEQVAAQELLVRLLAALGPMALDIMSVYLRLPPSVLLTHVQLLENIATLLPKLSDRIIKVLTTIIRDLMNGTNENYDLQTLLEALEVFPLNDPALAKLAQELVLWSLNEDKGHGPVMAALSLATNPSIGHHSAIQPLTYRAAQLLHADDPQIVHLALNVLSDPRLASVLDERSCSMILLALHQSLEPSIQIVAAKLLTHLTKAHRAIVQPLAWSHIRQSLGLMDFLQRVDPTRAIVEACIISNLLPALPKSLHKKYVGPVKRLILSGLEHAQAETPTLSLVFQGLANLASFEGWSASQQANLASDLLDMISEIPKDSQHAALNAVSRLLSIPTEGLEVYDLLIKVHAMLGGRSSKLEPDLKALVSSIYGHLGTVERNPVISRDSKAAINRETSMYNRKARLAAQVAEVKDRHRADSQTHINWLVTKNLLAAFAPEHKVVEERAIVLEVMISFGILQPAALPELIPDLPNLLFSELRNALQPKEGHKEVRDTSVPVSAGILLLSAALHISPTWLEEYWAETADVFGEALKGGEVLPVLRGLGVILDAIDD